MGVVPPSALRCRTPDTQFSGTSRIRFVPNGPYVTRLTLLPPLRKIKYRTLLNVYIQAMLKSAKPLENKISNWYQFNSPAYIESMKHHLTCEKSTKCQSIFPFIFAKIHVTYIARHILQSWISITFIGRHIP